MHGAGCYDVAAVCSVAPHLQFVEGAILPFVHEQMKLHNISPLAINLNSSCSGKTHSIRPDTDHGNENTKSGCNLARLRVSSMIRPLGSAECLFREGRLVVSFEIEKFVKIIISLGEYLRTHLKDHAVYCQGQECECMRYAPDRCSVLSCQIHQR